MVSGYSVKKVLKEATILLRGAGVTSPRIDAEVLLGFVLACNRLALYREPLRELSDEEIVRYRELLCRRAAGVPVAYLTGEKEFMGLNFAVTPAVLIPRPETELLVETAVDLLKGLEAPVVAEVGTGSGAIAVSLAVFLPAARVFAVDLSPAAIKVAQENARRHGVADRVSFYQGDLLGPFGNSARLFDLVAANLPYVRTADMAHLPREVQYEPVVALDGGPDGLGPYRRLLPQARRLLKTGAYLLMEIGPGQCREVLDMFEQWQTLVKADLAGQERLVVAHAGG